MNRLNIYGFETPNDLKWVPNNTYQYKPLLLSTLLVSQKSGNKYKWSYMCPIPYMVILGMYGYQWGSIEFSSFSRFEKRLY